MILKSIFYVAIPLVILTACGSGILDVDTTEVNMEIAFVNVDSIFVHSDSVQLIREHQRFKRDISEIYSYELGTCLGIGNTSDTAFYNSIHKFLNDKYVKRLEAVIGEKFKNKSQYEKEIIEGFKRLKVHFPKGKSPEHIVYLNTLFASNVFCTEKEIGIGLERYLGDKEDVIKELPGEQFFDWIKKGMNADYLERDVLMGWIMTHHVEPTEGNLAEQIVNWGKIIYLTEAAFPEMEEHIIMRWKKEDYEWAIKNEYPFWKYLVDEDMLFKIDELNARNILNEGPSTLGLPEKGPDRLGQFMGWQMVRSYQEIHELTLEELLELPYNEILQEYEID